MKLNKSKTLIAALCLAAAGGALAFTAGTPGDLDLEGTNDIETVTLKEVAARSRPSFLIDEVVSVDRFGSIAWMPDQPNIATMIVQHRINRVSGADLELTGEMDSATQLAFWQLAADAIDYVSEDEALAMLSLTVDAGMTSDETLEAMAWMVVLDAIGFREVTVEDDLVVIQCGNLAQALRSAGANTDEVGKYVEAAWKRTRCTLNFRDGAKYGPWAVDYGVESEFTEVGPPRVWIESWESAARAYLEATGES